MLKLLARQSNSIRKRLLGVQLHLNHSQFPCQHQNKNRLLIDNLYLTKFFQNNILHVVCFSTESYDGAPKEEERSDESSKTKDANDEATSNSFEKMKVEIMNHALHYVNDHGWSKKSISLGAEEAGYAGVAEGLFVNEGADLVLFFVKQSNQKLLEFMQEKVKECEENDEKLNVNIFIKDSLEFRLRLIIPYINVWAEGMKLLLSPKIMHESTDELSKMVDDIWFLAGDTSTGLEWYAKRGFIAHLFGGLQLVMLTDQTSDYKDTWTFLNQRFKDMETLKNFTESFKDNGENMANILKNFSTFTFKKH